MPTLTHFPGSPLSGSLARRLKASHNCRRYQACQGGEIDHPHFYAALCLAPYSCRRFLFLALVFRRSS
jgi:hypothetical protein